MRKLSFWALALLACPLLVLAENQHIEVGTRPMSEEAKKQIESEKGEERGAESSEASLGISAVIFDQHPLIQFSKSHHWLIAMTLLDNDHYTLELEDGSIWKISSYDGPKALNWNTKDPLLITQNNRWFSNFDYRILNKANGTSIEVNLYLGPIENGIYTQYITMIDLDRKEMMLSDHSHWEISYLDTSIFKDWAVNDAIIRGTNSGWNSSYETLLINVNMNNCLRAKEF